jgi:hypothetical protein
MRITITTATAIDNYGIKRVQYDIYLLLWGKTTTAVLSHLSCHLVEFSLHFATQYMGYAKNPARQMWQKQRKFWPQTFFCYLNIYSSGSQPFFARVPLSKKKKIQIPLWKVLEAIYVFFINNLKLLKIWRTPRDSSRTPGWEPLIYSILSFLFNSVKRGLQIFSPYWAFPYLSL